MDDMKMLEPPLTAGADEVGRGCIAGPLYAAAVILDPAAPITGLADSKKLTEKKRLQLNEVIRQKALSWKIVAFTAAQVDQFNVLKTSLLAMQQAVDELEPAPERVLIDGNQNFVDLDRAYQTETVIGGDAVHDCIMAASILAKVARDQYMVELHQHHPQYGFANHKGYPTAVHKQAMKDFGVLDEHRKSYKPVAECLAGMAK